MYDAMPLFSVGHFEIKNTHVSHNDRTNRKINMCSYSNTYTRFDVLFVVKMYDPI